MPLLRGAHIIRTAILWLAAAVIVVAPIACGHDETLSRSGVAPASEPRLEPSATDGPALRVYVERGGSGEQELLLIRPAGASSSQNIQFEDRIGRSRKEILARGLEVNGTERLAGHWGLVLWASHLCADNLAGEPFKGPDDEENLLWYPWSRSGDGSILYGHDSVWFIFERGALTQSCDQVLLAREVLLCAADRLAEIGNTVGTLVWQTKELDAEGETQPVTVTVPPQATADRFIAREAALYTLGHVARLYEVTPQEVDDSINGGCLGVYGHFASGATPAAADWQAFSQDGFDNLPSGGLAFNPDPSTYDPTERRTLGLARLDVESKINLAATRLLRTTIEEAVRDDLAGAEKAAARAEDPVKGAEARWGFQGSDEPAAYNSIGHALRVLFGRVEDGLPKDVLDDIGVNPDPDEWSITDPECGGFNALELINALPPGEDVRWSSPPPSTKDQSLAASMLADAGIVIRLDQIDNGNVSVEDARHGIIDQLLRNAGVNEAVVWNGAIPDTVSLSPRARAIVETASQLSNEDLVFALRRNDFLLQLLLTNNFAANRVADQAPDSFLDTWGIEKLPSADVAPTLPENFSGVIRGGIPREDLAADPMGRLLYLAERSQCEETYDASWPSEPTRRRRAALQNPFGLGWTLRDNARLILSSIPPNDSARRDMEFAIAEASAWMGDLLVAAHRDSDDAVSFTVALHSDGGVAEALGAPNPASAADATIAIVQSFLREAECIAGLRTQSCKDDHEGRIVTDPAVHWYDLGDGRTIEHVVTLNDNCHEGDPVFIVLRGTPERPGRILANLRIPELNSMVFDFVSPLQRELGAALFGLVTPESRAAACDDDEWDISRPAASCIYGIPRDQFIPLANELTTSGGTGEDSWRHYLSGAETAAAAADALGAEWIQKGSEQDLRREGAQAELANLCGSFVDVDALSAQDGKILPPNDQANLNACLDEEHFDVVYLTTPQWEDLPPNAVFESADFRNAVWGFYCETPPEGERPDFCEKKGNPSNLEIGALGLTSAVTSVREAGCSELVALAASTATGSVSENELTNAANGLSSASFGMAIKAYRFISYATDVDLGDGTPDPDIRAGDWQLRVDGAVALWGRGGTLMPCEPPYVFESDESLCTTLLQLFNGTPSGDPAGVMARVQSTLWTMGALAGEIPEGTFWIPVPVVDLNAGESAQAPAIYGDADVVVDLAGVARLDGANINNLNDAAVLGNLVHDDAATAAIFATYPQGAGWRGELYNDASADWSRYFLAPVQNAAIRFNTEMYDAGGSVADRVTALETWLSSMLMFHANRNYDILPYSQYLRQAELSLSAFSDSANGPANYPFYIGEDTRRDICLVNEMPVFSGEGGWLNVFDVLTRCDSCPAGAGSVEELTGVPVSGTEELKFVYTNIEDSVVPDESPECGRERSAAEYARIESGCLATGIWSPAPNGWHKVTYQLAGERLRPTRCGPDQRVELFLHNDRTGQERLPVAFARAVALHCLDRGGLGPSSAPPPSIESIRDVKRLEGWLSTTESLAVAALDVMALTNVPKRVVLDYNQGVVGTGVAGQGEHGQLLLQLRKDLEAMHLAWTNYVGNVSQIRSAVATARARFESVEGDTQIAMLQNERSRIELDRQVAMASVQTMFGAATMAMSAPTGIHDFEDPRGMISGMLAGMQQVAMGQISGMYAREALRTVALESAVIAGNGETDQNLVLIDLNSQASTGYTGLETAMSQFRASLADAQSTMIELEQNGGRAAVQVAQAAGADFVEVDGQPVDLLVNTVLNRQYGVLQLRYLRALESAKRAAYVARLAVEQRLGVRLSEIDIEVGPLPPPSTWADDLCTMQGVNYEALRARTVEGESSGTGGTSSEEDPEMDMLAGFSDQYIGDYVDNLREFMEFYNITYPFHETDDTAVLSLRSDLLSPISECTGEAGNLLFQSDRLDLTGRSGDDSASLGGWRTRPCSEEVCGVAVRGAALVAGGATVVPPDGRGAATWLRTLAPIPESAGTGGTGASGGGESGGTVTGGDGGAAWGGAVETGGALVITAVAEDRAPHGAVYQTVPLDRATSYVLSWWDMARSESGEDPAVGDPEGPYEIAVYDDSWRLVAFDSPIAQAPIGEAPGQWSERRTLYFAAASSGDHHIAFLASPLGTTGGSVAIANVQLEVVPELIGGPTDYESTDGNRWVFDADCRFAPDWNLRDAFGRVCEGGNDFGNTVPVCWWELKSPIVLDVELAQAGYGPLVGNMAVGNYNERHLSMAVNIVGTGVIDCSTDPSPDCYGEAYVEYDLVHSASNVPIVGYNPDDVRCFDFAIGAIRSGKALAAERYITIPLGSADSDLLSQPAFTKYELAGRPLSGTYRLRIKDTPRLAWERVEDIQLVMNYRAWSRVARPDAN